MARVIRKETRNLIRATGRLSDGSDRVETPYTEVVVTTDEGVATFDHDPTDDEIIAAIPKAVELEPTLAGGRKTIFEAAGLAAQRYAGMKLADDAVQVSGTAKQKTGSTALLDRAYQKYRRLAAAYADAVNE